MNTMKKTLLATCVMSFLTTGAALAEDLYSKADDTWISIKGKVESVSPDRFVLDYGKGLVTVEMDDGDRDADAYKLIKGDEVTVNGIIDDDLFETTTIEASSVYVDDIDTYFFASSLDEEDTTFTVTSVVPLTSAVVQGTVTDIRGDEFTLDRGARKVEVEVESMAYNPLDDEGYQKIRVGDRVSVSGQIESEFFEGQVLEADSIIKLVGR